jgi:hypothetical protein
MVAFGCFLELEFNFLFFFRGWWWSNWLRCHSQLESRLSWAVTITIHCSEHCSVVQHIATCCTKLEHVAICCTICTLSQNIAAFASYCTFLPFWNMLQHFSLICTSHFMLSQIKILSCIRRCEILNVSNPQYSSGYELTLIIISLWKCCHLDSRSKENKKLQEMFLLSHPLLLLVITYTPNFTP